MEGGAEYRPGWTGDRGRVVSKTRRLNMVDSICADPWIMSNVGFPSRPVAYERIVEPRQECHVDLGSARRLAKLMALDAVIFRGPSYTLLLRVYAFCRIIAACRG